MSDPLECALCGRRYTVTDALEYRLFAATMVCYRCYGRMQALPATVSCFGKADQYDLDCEECETVCPDRQVCHKVLIPGFRLPSLEMTAESWRQRVGETVGKIEERSADDFWIDKAGAVRLLTLKAWVQHYHVSLDFLLRALFKFYYHIRRKMPSRGSFGLGIRAYTLCGRKSREIIAVRVAEAYPCQENVVLSRVQLATRLLGLAKPWSPAHTESLMAMTAKYVEGILARRRSYATAGNRFKRAWRGNPWKGGR